MAADGKLQTMELLYRSAQQMGLRPSWVRPGRMFAVSVNGYEKYVHDSRSPLNSHTSVSLAKNKYLTRLILERHQMPNIPFTRTANMTEGLLFLRKYKKIIAKPIDGHGSRDINIVTAASQLQGLNISNYILEQYISGQELRYLVLNNRVIGVHRSDYGTSVEETRPLRRISYPSGSWSPELTSLSKQVAQALDLKFATVDYLVDANGRTYILEVNSRPGLKWFHAPTSGPTVDVAGQFLAAIFENHKVTGIKQEDHPALAYS